MIISLKMSLDKKILGHWNKRFVQSLHQDFSLELRQASCEEGNGLRGAHESGASTFKPRLSRDDGGGVTSLTVDSSMGWGMPEVFGHLRYGQRARAA